ncbi:MAG TPA: glyoxalase [Thermomonas sp.]|jgi:hypothetical protein|nr:glyoxalase [Thermomonas sp.]
MNLATVEIKAFVPARDFVKSKEFYACIGFEIPWSSEDLAYVRNGDTSFLLQKFHIAEHTANFMMHLLVICVDDWYQHILDSGVVGKFGVRIEPPQDRPWGLRDFPLVDPSGVLWRIGQSIASAD